MTGNTTLQQQHTALIPAAQKGDRNAMGRLIELELPWIKAVIAGYVKAHDVVDDLCQETFVSAWQNIGKLRKRSGFKSWLYTIAVNKVRSFLRSKNRNQSHFTLDENQLGSDGPVSEELLEKRELLQSALFKLEPKYRDPLIVFYFHGKSCEETGKALGIKPSTTRIRLLRGREKLRDILTKEGTL